MRIRATVAAVSGALALSAFAVPVAQADEAAGDLKITNISVNGGKDVVIGTTEMKKFTLSVTATDPAGVRGTSGFLWFGADFGTSREVIAPVVYHAECVAVDATTKTCSDTVVAFPQDLRNAHAGTRWNVFATAVNNQGDKHREEYLKSDARLKRNARLTVNASPEPVKKGRTITVSGALTRANWDTGKYAGYTQQPVQLQFKKKGASGYSTLKTVKSDAKGNLRTTVKASADGTFRYVFAGTSTTPAVTSAGDAIDVR
ncbi:calcium-binding protein [Streptomyces sp. NPDC047071]|uniref:calcium-binding protein n=1 Tax=Streptomyces sp. NPDC047071 TaxID=3154808 RepID=UPI0034540CD8